MSIVVVCANCGRRFNVSDKFAGKSGPCPICKQTINVPPFDGEEDVDDSPTTKNGKGVANGQLTTQPIFKRDLRRNIYSIAAVAGGTSIIFVLTILCGKTGVFQSGFAVFFGLALVSPLLAFAGYRLLYNDELEPYKGKSAAVRSMMCGLIYTVFWMFYAYLEGNYLTGELWNGVFVAPPFFAAGAITASLIFDLEYSDGFLHYSFYLFATIILRWAAGFDWIWKIKTTYL